MLDDDAVYECVRRHMLVQQAVSENVHGTYPTACPYGPSGGRRRQAHILPENFTCFRSPPDGRRLGLIIASPRWLECHVFMSVVGGSACDAFRYRRTGFEFNNWSIEMDTEKAEGAVREVAGKVQGAAGALVGDSATQLAGKARELSGKAQQLCADYVSMVRETAVTKPFTALAVVAAASFVAGAIWRAGGSTRDDR